MGKGEGLHKVIEGFGAHGTLHIELFTFVALTGIQM